MNMKEIASLHQQSGATLLESLISMVVVALGLLGVLSLQVYAVKGGQSSHTSSQVTTIAYELFDLMRAKREDALEGAFADGETGDRAYWDARVSAVLGSDASGKLVQNGNRFQLTLVWNDSRGAVVDADGNAKSGDDQGKLTLSTEI